MKRSGLPGVSFNRKRCCGSDKARRVDDEAAERAFQHLNWFEELTRLVPVD